MRLPSVSGVAARLEGPAQSSPEARPEVLGPRCGAHQLCQFQGETILRMLGLVYVAHHHNILLMCLRQKLGEGFQNKKKIVEISTLSLIPLHPSTQCGTSTLNPFWCAADIFNAHKQLGSS